MMKNGYYKPIIPVHPEDNDDWLKDMPYDWHEQLKAEYSPKPKFPLTSKQQAHDTNFNAN